MLSVPTENEILQACLAWLKYNGVDCWRQNNTGVYDKATGTYRFHGLKGVSDILGILPFDSKRPGVFLAVETKRPGNKPSEDQVAFMDMITRSGGVAMWVTSVSELETDMKEFIDLNQSRMEF